MKKEEKKEVKEKIVSIAFSGDVPFAVSDKGKIYKLLNGAWVPFVDGL